MPLYDFKCKSCMIEWEEFSKMDGKDDVRCERCGGEGVSLITIRSKPNVFMEEYDEGLDAVVTGPAHRRQIMKERHYEEV